jgi:arylsulfatase A
LESGKHDYGPDVFTNFILDFIDRNQEDPFLVYYPMVLTHDPFVPTPDSPEWQDTPNKKDKRFFAHMVNYMDKLVGRIHHKLEELNLSEETILIFTADNGTHRSIRSATQTGVVLGGKGTTPNAGTHVPMIAYWKGKTPVGKVSSDLIDFSDMFPTFGEAMKVEHPNPSVLEGRSFLSSIER